MLRKTFLFTDNEEQAKTLCKQIQKSQNSYRQTYHKPHYTPWESSDHTEHKYVVWYVI